MFSNSRLEEIFIQISKNEFTTIKELTNSFHVTDRTIRTDIQATGDTRIQLSDTVASL